MSDSEENASDEDDSNDENNWRNDYPDEDEFNESIGEDDMRKAIEDFDIGKGTFKTNPRLLVNPQSASFE